MRASHGNVTVPFQSNGAVVLRDRRGTSKAEIPDVDQKSEGFGSDPLAIYKPTGAKAVSPAKAMANFNGWTFAAVNAIASEVANIQFRLYKVSGDNHEEQDDHELLTLLDGVNEFITPSLPIGFTLVLFEAILEQARFNYDPTEERRALSDLARRCPTPGSLVGYASVKARVT